MSSWPAPGPRLAAGSRGHKAPGRPTMPITSISLRVESMSESRFARPDAHDHVGFRLQSPGLVAEHTSAGHMPRTNDMFPHGSPGPRRVGNPCLNVAPCSSRTSLLPRARAIFDKMLELSGGTGASIGGTKFYTKLTIPGLSEQIAARGRLSAVHMAASTCIGNSGTPTGGWQRDRDLSLHSAQSAISIGCFCPGPW